LNGVDPLRFMQDPAGRIEGMRKRNEIQRALDVLESLMDVYVVKCRACTGRGASPPLDQQPFRADYLMLICFAGLILRN